MSERSSEDRNVGDSPSFSTEIDAICDRFEAAWKAGQEPKIEDHLLPQADAAARRQLLVELVKLDLGYRWQRASDRDAATIEHDATPVGEPARLSWKPRLEEYLSGYPELGPPADLPVSLIATEYRARLLAGDRPQPEDYLARFPGQRDGLRELFARMDNESAQKPQPAESGWQPGTRVKYFGDYELLEEIARGGMGVVYKARQREPQPHRGPEDDPGRAVGRRSRRASGSMRRPRRPPTSTIRASCRSTRSASTRASTTSPWATSRARVSPARLAKRPAAAQGSGGVDRRRGRGGRIRPRQGRHPPRPEAGQHPYRSPKAGRGSPTSAWPSGSTATAV